MLLGSALPRPILGTMKPCRRWGTSSCWVVRVGFAEAHLRHDEAVPKMGHERVQANGALVGVFALVRVAVSMASGSEGLKLRG